MTEAESPETLVTVIITTYNYGRFIQEAIQSVLAQTATADLQIIVVDDGSTDETPDVLARVKDPRVELVRTANRGISGARNEALARARGDFIAFLDGDDRWAPHKLEYQLEVMRSEPDMAAVFANFVRFDERGVYPRDQFSFYTELAAVPTRATRNGRGYRILVDAFSAFITFVEYPVWVQTILFRREAVRDLLFPVTGSVLNSNGKGVCGDIPFCFSAYHNGAVGFLKEHLVEVRRHGKKRNRSTGNYSARLARRTSTPDEAPAYRPATARPEHQDRPIVGRFRLAVRRGWQIQNRGCQVSGSFWAQWCETKRGKESSQTPVRLALVDVSAPN
jgi:glycosyltransferase involved in cell wall biosynthesis